MRPADYVLQNFSADEEIVFETLRSDIADAAECWFTFGIDLAMNRFNTSAKESTTTRAEPDGGTENNRDSRK